MNPDRDSDAPEREDEAHLHALFATLRRQAVEASRDFLAAVSRRLAETPELHRAVPPGAVARGALVEALNILSRLLGAGPDEPPTAPANPPPTDPPGET